MVEPRESYAHKAAKQVVFDWIQEIYKESDPKDSYVHWGHMSWRPNYEFMEYPVLPNGGGIVDVLWNEHYWSEGEEYQNINYIPTYEVLCEEGKPPAAILDLVITHKGSVLYIIEITHKHPLSREKIDFLYSLDDNIQIIELPADYVLRQFRRPTKIPRQYFVPWSKPTT